MNRDEKISALVAHLDDGVRRSAFFGVDEHASLPSRFAVGYVKVAQVITKKHCIHHAAGC
jgi:hypothetical protein